MSVRCSSRSGNRGPVGRANPERVVNETGIDRPNAEDQLRRQHDAGWIREIVRSRYEFVADPRASCRQPLVCDYPAVYRVYWLFRCSMHVGRRRSHGLRELLPADSSPPHPTATHLRSQWAHCAHPLSIVYHRDRWGHWWQNLTHPQTVSVVVELTTQLPCCHSPSPTLGRGGGSWHLSAVTGTPVLLGVHALHLPTQGGGVPRAGWPVSIPPSGTFRAERRGI